MPFIVRTIDTRWCQLSVFFFSSSESNFHHLNILKKVIVWQKLVINKYILLNQYIVGCLLCIFNPILDWINYIFKESNFRYIRLYDLGIPREKWLNYLQAVETLIRCCRMWHLIRICTVCGIWSGAALFVNWTHFGVCRLKWVNPYSLNY